LKPVVARTAPQAQESAACGLNLALAAAAIVLLVTV